tara:strand:- start:5362 stop:6057 length:696 start_codon:yes stop_codon:yes gene_type:complete
MKKKKLVTKIILIFVMTIIIFDPNLIIAETKKSKFKIQGEKNFLHEYESVNLDGYINVVVEIPAGNNEKWEVSKIDGSLEWEYLNNSYRTIKYLPYIFNYGFVPKTLYSKELGGDGDPVDVILLGKSYERGSVITSKVLGSIIMKDQGEMDDKIIAIPIDSKIFISDNLNSINDLDKNYPGVTNIIEIWFKNYKRNTNIEILGYNSNSETMNLIYKAQKPYETLRGYWLDN